MRGLVAVGVPWGVGEMRRLRPAFLAKYGAPGALDDLLDLPPEKNSQDELQRRTADFLRQNFVLKDGDILYVDERGSSKFNYYLSKLLPSMDVVDFSIRTAESFGAMQQLRKKMWDQEGFVNQGY